jgi:stearoyl-CoA desaturase (delta-9 desaturase)
MLLAHGRSGLFERALRSLEALISFNILPVYTSTLIHCCTTPTPTLSPISHMDTTGLLNWPWWALSLVTLLVTHVSIASVTLYLHRGLAHRALDFHPLVSHFFRVWLWLTTGMNTLEWVAIHRKHHAKVDTVEDPHSPQTHGLKKVLLVGVMLYVKEAKNLETLRRFGAGTPDDWVERHVYTPYPWAGLVLTAAVDIALFGVLAGAAMLVVQVAWIPFWAAGVVNGVGHYLGYRNFDCADASRNLSPWGILIGGEELHNNHHAHPTSAKLSFRAHEFDIGWLYIQLLARFGLATVKKRAPHPKKVIPEALCGPTTLQAILTNRYSVLRDYAKMLKATSATELDPHEYQGLKSVWMRQKSADLRACETARIEKAYVASPALRKLAQFRTELCALWDDATANEHQLVERLNAWCHRAEDSGVPPLRRFAQGLRQYA